jgi:peptidoglycan/LPS O-acetylase OafA/YrhL
MSIVTRGLDMMPILPLSQSSPAAVGRLSQLDGLRGLAILGVLANHFLPFPGSYHCGWLGVNLFFVLSGFLITRILLEQRQMVEVGGSVLRSLGIFYARRALRIFPLYYFTLAVLWTCDFQQSRDNAWWLATYTYNIRTAVFGFSQTYDHFWSLCVEEQFYLVWPGLVLTLSPRFLGKFLGATFLLAPAWRVGCMFLGTHTRFPLYAATFACLDCLAAGALLAHFEGRPIAWPRFLGGCRAVGLGLMAVWLLVSMLARPRTWHQVPVEWVFGNTAMAVFFAWVVGRAAEGCHGDWGALLRMRWLSYLGTISYSVYVLHNFAPLVWTSLVPRPWKIEVPAPYAHLALSILAGALTWHLVERPIQRLKRLIPYEPFPQREAANSPDVIKRAA